MVLPASHHGHNKAWYNIPPVLPDKYDPKGTYEQLGGIAGPSTASKGLISIFDPFGFASRTMQGADILAFGHKNRGVNVFVPDWFVGFPVPSGCQVERIVRAHTTQDVAARLPNYAHTLQVAYPSITSWGIHGYCWGGKVVEFNSASKIPVPYAMLASMEDPVDAVRYLEAELRVPHHVEIFDDQAHRWMAARAGLCNPRAKKECARGYRVLLDFFAEQWP
ncbi:hypothetical protein EJ03DRAFT_342684 [Teratosphaeria nubilosa]|uniref:Dienelactone hydrolase domain-containing protein n=1 Tax=Teratosphaeria nubilosa TaxID=161662 RepID=A0A6G1LCI9_9PEZI|nr:hypothetical protein EJ03DRAFT_342684 [Teratosphaeria nubilosa]